MKLWKIALLCVCAPLAAQVQLGRNVQIGAGGTGGGCSTGGIPTTNGSVTGDPTSTNCGTDNRSGDTASVPANVQTFGHDAGTGNKATESVLIGDTPGANLNPVSGSDHDLIGIGDFVLDCNLFFCNEGIAIGDSVANLTAGSNFIGLGNGSLSNSFVTNTIGMGQGAAATTAGDQPATTADVIALGNGAVFLDSSTTPGDPIISFLHDVIGVGNGAGSHIQGNSHDILGMGDGAGANYATGTHDVVALGDGAGSGVFGSKPTITDIVALGDNVCPHLGTGSSDVFCLGHGITPASLGAVVNNAIGIGSGITLGSNQTIIGNSSTTQTDIYGTTTIHGAGTINGLDVPEGTAGSGTSGHDLLWADATSHCWMISNNGGSGVCIPTSGGSSPLTTKGDLFGHSTVDARIPVGSDGQVLTADSTQALGVKWSAGGSATVIKYASQLGAALNADLNYPGKTPSGGTATDDSAVLNAFLATATASNPVTLIMDGAALACKVHGPQAGNWSIIGQGGGVAQVPITAWSITSNVVTFTTKPQTLVAGQIVSLGGLSSGSFMNGTSLVPIPLRVSATGLTSTSFQAAFTHANASATETGEADFLYGTGFVAPMGCNGDVINNADSSTMYSIIPPEFGANISISNLIINGNRYDGTLGNSTTGDPLGPIVAPPQAYTVWYNDINISATNGVLIDHVWLYNAPSFMFKCNGCNSLQVTNSHFENVLPNQAHVAQNGDGIHIDGPSHDIYIANDYIRAMDDGIAFNAGEGICGPIARATIVNVTEHDSSSLGRMYTSTTACPSGLFPTVSTVDMTNFSGDAIVVGFEMGLESARTFTMTDMITDVKWSNSTITTQYPMVFMDPTGDITFDNMTWVPTQNNAGFVTTAYNTLSNNSLNFQNVHIKRTGSGFGGVSLLDTVHGYIGGAGTPTFTRLNVNGFQMVDDGGSYSAGGPVLNLNTNATITTLYSGGTNDLTKVANGYLFSPSMAARVTSIATQTLYGDIASNNPLPFTINTPSGSGLFSASPNTVGSHSAIGVGNSSSAHNALYNAWFNTTVPYGSYQTYAAGDPLEYDATFHFFDGGPMSVGISGGFTGASLPTLPGLFNVGTTSQFFVTSAGAATATNITDSALTSGNCVQASTGGLLVTTASPCGSSGGSVTTTGSPVSGNLTKFSGASSITNADLSGDCTTSGTLSVTCTKINGITISGTPATGYVPTATSSSTATWQAASGSSGPLFKQYTYVIDSTAASVTTPAITVATGDLVVASCRYTSGSAGTVTSSPANTFNALTAQTGSGTLVQMSWGIVASGASTTFTCTQSSSTAGISIVVLDYSGTGTTLNTSSGAVGGTETITTTQRTLQVQCGASPSGLAQFIPGVMGGTYGQLVGVSQSTLAATNADQGCQQVVVPWAQPGVASSFTGTTSLTTTAAFNY